MSLETTKTFIQGGKAFLTLKNSATLVRRTYKFEKPKNKDIKNLIFVSLLTGSDNEGSYSFMGSINAERMTYKHSVKSRITSICDSTKAIEYLLMCFNRGTINENMELWHEGKCCRCGRKLTTPESIQSGIGPECAKK